MLHILLCCLPECGSQESRMGQEEAYIREELAHVTLPVQGTGEQGQQLGVSLKAEGGRCVSHRDHPLGAPHHLQDLWLPLIGHSDPKHKPALWEKTQQREGMARALGVHCCWGLWAPVPDPHSPANPSHPAPA